MNEIINFYENFISLDKYLNPLFEKVFKSICIDFIEHDETRESQEQIDQTLLGIK